MFIKRIILILGDQLDDHHPALNSYDSNTDIILMVESSAEASYVWSHKARIAIFLSAMRHFAERLSQNGYNIIYIKESDLSLVEAIQKEIIRQQATHLVFVTPGEWRLKNQLESLAIATDIQICELEDTHFYCSPSEFKEWVGNKKELRLEYFYRYMRKKHGILMECEDVPEGGQWNFDDQNRKPFSKQGPGLISPPLFFEHDAITSEVLAYVEMKYPAHPGALDHFGWPVSRPQCLEALEYFIQYRLVNFGTFQDAMWENTPFGWHSVLSAALNLKLLNPREVIQAVLSAYREKHLDLSSIEGFIRQIIGWREFVRGVYYLDMPQMAAQNFYGHKRPLPTWYWTASTQMNCMKDTIGQTLKYGYAHHIQRLMVTGNFALLAELLPSAVSEWYLAVYVDAIEWVEMPNVMGMALFANGGRFTSKPYIASGAYINRMSNYCQGCIYNPSIKSGDQACPVTVLYWHFLIKHQKALEKNPRTRLMTVHLNKLEERDKESIKREAQNILGNLNAL